jgi:signal transduction histidine kinase/CheY-like chemotaxis protein
MTTPGGQIVEERLAALLQATQALASSLDVEEILQTIVDQAAAVSGAPIVRLFLLETHSNVLRCRVAVGLSREAAQALTIPVGESLSGQVAATGEPVAVEDTRKDPRALHQEYLRQYNLISYLGLPVKAGDRLFGVLVFNTNAPRVYRQEEIAFLSAIARQAALAIQNARLHETTRRRAQQLATLNTLTRTLSTVLDPRRAAQEILASVQALIPGAAGRLWERVREDNTLRLVTSIGLNEPEGGVRRRLLLGEGLTGVAAATREPVTSRDVTSDPRFINKAWAASEGLVSGIIVPLLYGDAVNGVLAIFTRVPHDFSSEEVDLLCSFAAQAAIAIENARLYGATERAARETRSLYEVAHSLTTSLDPTEVLRLVSLKTTELLGTPHAQVVLWDEETKTLRLGAAHGTEVERVRDQQFRLGEGVNGLVAQRRAPLIVNDYQVFPHRVKDMPELVAVIGVPLLYRGRLLGVLTSHATQPGWTFTHDHLALLTSFADQAAVAIENARLYNEIRHHAAELEVRVRERTAALEEALRVKAEFLATMSHELRTPLNSILGFAEVLQQGTPGPLTPKQAQYLDRIRGGGKRLLDLVSDILNLAQVEAGKSRLQLESVRLAPLVQEAVARVQVAKDQKRLEVTTALEPELPLVVADRGKLGQILVHLLGNAVKFTPEGGKVRVSSRQVDWSTGQLVDSSRPIDQSTARPFDSGGEWVEIVVEDTGIGLRSEDLEQIFVAFHQVDASGTRLYGGAGVGLALVRRLVELHGGRIWAESPGLGRGARFIVRLPRLEAPRPKRILLVEDEEPILEALDAVLGNAGYTVERARDGAEALARLASTRPDLLVLDIGLPDMDGWAVLKRVRETDKIWALPVLVLTGQDQIHGEQAQARGADEFLTKPVSARVMVETVGLLLERSVREGMG